MDGSPFKPPASSPRKECKTPPIHSTPSEDRGDSDSSIASSFSGRTSGRSRKKTERGAAFDESLKQKKTKEEEDLSDECAEPFPDATLSTSSLPQKRGRPRKSETFSQKGNPKQNTANDSTPCTGEKSLADSSDIVNAEPSSDVAVIEFTPPRKRGRPRKSESYSRDREPRENSESGSTGEKTLADPADETTAEPSPAVPGAMSSQPRKRGRPPKSKTVLIDKEKAESVSATPPRKSETPAEPPSNVSVSPINPHKTGQPWPSESGSPDREPRENSGSGSSNTQGTGEKTLADPADETATEPSPVVPVTLSSQPRKRGRPPKSKADLNDKEKRESVSTPCVREQSQTDPPSTQQSSNINDRNQPRKRGRPRKLKPPNDDTEAKQDAEDSLDTSGAVEAASFVEEPMEGGGSDVVETPKRKRGRPKKQKPAESQEVPQHKDNEETEETRSPRKRERKISSFYYEDNSEGDDEEQGPRKRKRIRKIARDMEYGENWEEGQGEEDEEQEKVVVKKKRGRKPKARDPESGEIEDSGVKIEACLRCGEKMDNLASYKNHLVSKHAALYKKSCPEGEQTFSAIQQILNVRKVISCPKCRKKFRFTQYFKHHLEWCGREDEKVQCEQCRHWVKAMWLKQHMREHRKKDTAKEDERKQLHTVPGKKRKAATESIQKMKATVEEYLNPVDGSLKKRKRKPTQDNDYDGKDVDEDNNENEDEDEEEEDSGSDIERSRSGHYGGPKIYIHQAPDYFEEHQDFLAKLPKGSLFTTLLPLRAEWTPLSESESAGYLPVNRESVPVSVKRGKAECTEPARLQWGEAISDDKQSTAFAGGTVWSVEWCPLHEEETSQRNQVLAVSASREQWDSWTFNKREEGPGHIQFWTVGNLDDCSSEVEPCLKPAFNIAHDYCRVLDMAWCPRRAYLQAQFESAETFPRLGLLAVAGYHSNVAVYSIPTPDAVKGWMRERGEGGTSTPPTFKPTPTLTLLCSDPDLAGACLSVAWQKRDGCDFIAGGYTKGFVELWHLSSESPVVRKSTDTLSSVRCFYAHYGIRSVDWSWVDATQFVTASVENQIGVWDVKDTRKPLVIHPDTMVYEKGPTCVVQYGSSVLDAVLYCDEQRDVISGSVYGMDLSLGFLHGSEVKKVQCTVARHSATVWDLSYNPWYNVVASGDTTGLMYVSTCQPVLYPNRKGMTRARRGLPVFVTRCKQIPEGQENEMELFEEDKEDKFMEDEITSAEGLHITFHDRDLEGKKDLINTGREESICRTDVSGFRAADIYSTAFNPNKPCSRWLACGVRAGFLRLLHLPCLSNETETAKRFFRK